MAQSIKSLIGIESSKIQKMSKKELREVVSILASAANKRLVRLSETAIGELSPAYKSAMKRSYTGIAGGKFGVKGKTLNQLRNEYKAVKDFLQMKTGSVTSWKSYRGKIYERIGGGFDDIEAEKEFWRTYRKIDNIYPIIGKMAYGSQEAQTDLRRLINGAGSQQIIEYINRNSGLSDKMIAELNEKGEVYDKSRGKSVKIGNTTDTENALTLMSLKVGIEYEKLQENNGIYDIDFYEI